MCPRWLITCVTAFSLMITAQSHAALDMKAGKALAKDSGCFACHRIDSQLVGPAWSDVSKKYKSNAEAKKIIIDWVKGGGSGRWDLGTMPSYGDKVSDENIEKLADFILSLAK